MKLKHCCWLLCLLVLGPALAQERQGLANYVDRMMIGVLSNTHHIQAGDRILLTSFVDAADYSRVDTLGFYVQDQAQFVLRDYGLSVAVHQLANTLSVSVNGDRMLSRDIRKLAGNLQADYVLLGTIEQTAAGVYLHARLVHVPTQVIEGSGRVLVPWQELEGLHSVRMQNGKVVRHGQG